MDSPKCYVSLWSVLLGFSDVSGLWWGKWPRDNYHISQSDCAGEIPWRYENVVLYSLHTPFPLWWGSGYETTQSYDNHARLAGQAHLWRTVDKAHTEMDRPVSAGHRGQRRNSSTCDLHPQWGIAMETCETIGICWVLLHRSRKSKDITEAIDQSIDQWI